MPAIRSLDAVALRPAAVLLLFVALTVVHSWPLARVASTEQLASADMTIGVWSMVGLATQLVTDPAHLFDGNNLYPDDRTLAVVDHQLGSAPFAAAVLALGGNGLLAFHVALLASFVLSGALMTLLVHRLTGSTAAGIVAGCAFAWSPFRIGELEHPHMLVTQWIPLALLGLHLFVERPGKWRGLLLITGAVAVALSSMHVALLGGLLLAIVTLLLLVPRGRRRLASRLPGIGLAGAAAAVVLVPVALVYSSVAARWSPPGGGNRETQGSLADMSMRLGDLLAAPAQSTAPWAEHLQPTARLAMFPGLVVLALAAWAILGALRSVQPLTRAERAWVAVAMVAVASIVAGALSPRLGMPGIATAVAAVSPLVPLAIASLAVVLLLLRRHSDPRTEAVLVYLGVVLAALLLALGPRLIVAGIDLGSGLTRFDLLPVPLMMRAPWRFFLLGAVGLSVLAGLGAERLLRGRAGLTGLAIVALLVVSINVEASRALPPRHELQDAPVDRWLAQLEEPGAVIEYPLRDNYWSVYRSYRYQRRTVNGRGYLGPAVLRSVEGLEDFSTEQLELLWRHFRPRFVVVRLDVYPEDRRATVEKALADSGGALVPRFRDGSDRVFELVDRGRGPSLAREWPGRMLRDADAIAFHGRVTAGRPWTVPVLTVLLNDRTLWSASGSMLEQWGDRVVPYPREDLIDGINRFELRAGYRYADGVDPHAIGGTGVAVPADLTADADSGRALVEVNGRQLLGGYGYLVVVLEPATGEVAAVASFDTFGSDAASRSLADFLDGVAPGSPVLVATRYDAGRRLGPEAVQALRRIGMTVDLRGRPGAAHAGIGVQGARPGTAIESSGPEGASVTLGQVDRRRVQLRWLDLVGAGLGDRGEGRSGQ